MATTSPPPPRLSPEEKIHGCADVLYFPVHWRLISHSQSAIFEKTPDWLGGERVLIPWLQHSRVCCCMWRICPSSGGQSQLSFVLLSLFSDVNYRNGLTWTPCAPQSRPWWHGDKMKCRTSGKWQAWRREEKMTTGADNSHFYLHVHELCTHTYTYNTLHLLVWGGQPEQGRAWVGLRVVCVCVGGHAI